MADIELNRYFYYEPEVPLDVLHAMRALSDSLEPLREHAIYKTGSINEASMCYLYLMMEKFQPKTVVEIGTFIGKSTMAMLSYASLEKLYTCDKDNACLETNCRRVCYPKTTSTAMLADLVEKVHVDFWFIDGRIQGPDIALMLRMSHANTVWAFDDYEKLEKGVVNVGILFPYLDDHCLVSPPETIMGATGACTIAMLVPKELV